MKTSNLITCVLLFSMTISSCKTWAKNGDYPQNGKEQTTTFPSVTENGVEPFLLGQSVKNIPSKGLFYDGFVWTKTYNIFIGDHYMELDEEEYRDYEKRFGKDEYEFLGVSSNAVVVLENDTLLIVQCNESGIIESLEIRIYDNYLNSKEGQSNNQKPVYIKTFDVTK